MSTASQRLITTLRVVPGLQDNIAISVVYLFCFTIVFVASLEGQEMHVGSISRF
jgi:hypothetical protein